MMILKIETDFKKVPFFIKIKFLFLEINSHKYNCLVSNYINCYFCLLSLIKYNYICKKITLKCLFWKKCIISTFRFLKDLLLSCSGEYYMLIK